MKRSMMVLFALVAGASSSAFAQADLAKSKNCMACHAVGSKLVGPAYKDVAAKYAKDKDAVAKLSDKIVKGGTGVWGQIPMPANAVTPDEAKTLVTWVLAQK